MKSAFAIDTVHNGYKVRRERLGGRSYYVVPVTMIVPGVLSGNQGALYYPPEEVSKNHTAWNNVPIVLKHPVENGRAISARDPKVLNESAVGMVLRTNVKRNLTSEAWIDINRANKVDPRIVKRIEARKPIEISTGLFLDQKDAPRGSAYRGRRYDRVAVNYRPDHLAILLDEPGACSVSDGCGLGVNAATANADDCDWKTVGGTPICFKNGKLPKNAPAGIKKAAKERGDKGGKSKREETEKSFGSKKQVDKRHKELQKGVDKFKGKVDKLEKATDKLNEVRSRHDKERAASKKEREAIGRGERSTMKGDKPDEKRAERLRRTMDQAKRLGVDQRTAMKVFERRERERSDPKAKAARKERIAKRNEEAKRAAEKNLAARKQEAKAEKGQSKSSMKGPAPKTSTILKRAREAGVKTGKLIAKIKDVIGRGKATKAKVKKLLKSLPQRVRDANPKIRKWIDDKHAPMDKILKRLNIV